MDETTAEFGRRFFLSRGFFAAGAVVVSAGGYQITGPSKPGKEKKPKVRQSSPGAPTTTVPESTTTVPTSTSSTTTSTTTTTTTTTEAPQAPDAGVHLWSDPATWGGAVPSPGTWVSIDKPVTLDVDVNVNGVAIQPGGSLVFDPNSSRTLTSTANVVVLGLLQMRPASAAHQHILRFTGIDESKFVGGGMTVLDSDVGLWCLNQGVLDLSGTTKRAWSRTSESVASGATSITLRAAPVGWEVGDEIAIVPTVGPETRNHHDAYDYATVAWISGSTIGLSSPTTFPHPVVDVGHGTLLGPEVLNLTRNVNIEGTPGGRAHIFVMTHRPQHMSYFTARWMAPRQPSGDFTGSVLGRYALHFHMGHDATRGSQIVGGVVRDAGGHAFVAHESDGMTFTSCISHNTFDTAYWWDDRESIGADPPPTHDVLYESCVASRVLVDPSFRGHRLSGFAMAAGDRNRALNCVAVGVQGNRDASGFIWREGTRSVWDFQQCISHNNKCNGFFVWQNSTNVHIVENFACYHNGIAGVAHGAYVTSYTYQHGYLFGNGVCAINLHSNSHSAIAQRFINLHCEGTSDYAVQLLKHRLPSERPTQFLGCTFVGQSKAAVATVYDHRDGDTTPECVDIIECTATSPLLWMREDTNPDSVIRVQNDGAAVVATPIGTAGSLRAEWNAMVTPVDAFWNDSVPIGGGTLVVSPGAVV